MLSNTEEYFSDRNYATQQGLLSRLDYMDCEKESATGGHCSLTSVEELDEFERLIHDRKHFR